MPYVRYALSPPVKHERKHFFCYKLFPVFIEPDKNMASDENHRPCLPLKPQEKIYEAL